MKRTRPVSAAVTPRPVRGPAEDEEPCGDAGEMYPASHAARGQGGENQLTLGRPARTRGQQGPRGYHGALLALGLTCLH